MILFLFTSVLLIGFSPIAKAKPQLTKSFHPHSAESLLQYETFHSIGNYNSKGQYVNLPGTNSFWNNSGFDFSGRYVFNHEFAMNLGLNYNEVQVNVGDFTKYNSSLQTLKVGLENKIDSRFADFILEGVGQVSLYNVTESSIRPPAGDGANGFGGNLWVLQRVWSQFYWHGKAGLLFRSQGLSGLFPYQLGLHWQIDSLTLSGVLDGYSSITPDSSTEVKRQNYLNKSSVGSYSYRSFNPSSGSLDFQAQWHPTAQFGINGGMGRTLIGRNSSNGTHFFFGIDIHWDTSPKFIDKNPFKNTLPLKSTNFNDSLEEDKKEYPISL